MCENKCDFKRTSWVRTRAIFQTKYIHVYYICKIILYDELLDVVGFIVINAVASIVETKFM